MILDCHSAETKQNKNNAQIIIDARRAYMIRNRLPGPYDDTTGPTVLGLMLMLSILSQFSLKLYSLKG